MVATTILCTVGTSLESNLRSFHLERFIENLSAQEIKEFTHSGTDVSDYKWRNELQKIVELREKKDWASLGKILTLLPGSARLLGAEINSMYAMWQKKIINNPLERLVLLTSDTEIANRIAAVLRAYFLAPQSSLPCSQVLVHSINGLQDKNPEHFQFKGLPNLIRILGAQARQWSASHMAINATGGYKAQIAFAVLFGQALSVPVYYKHELFNQIIAFPTTPFTIDLRLLENNLRFWANLAEPNAVFSFTQLQELDAPNLKNWETILPLLETISESNETYYALSPLGLIYWEALCSRKPDLELEPIPATKNTGCRFRDDHYPKGFKIWAQRVNERFPFITGCHSLDYSGQQSLSFGFTEDQGKIIGVYKDRTGFGARLEILTTCTNALERHYVVRVLNSWKIE